LDYPNLKFVGWYLQAIHALGKVGDSQWELKFIRYAQSNKAKGDSDSSVSYASASLVVS
jgi:predicted class III extradiol MEMO1 family dioxygenase